MKKQAIFLARLAVGLTVLLLSFGCTPGASFKNVKFSAPSRPDPALRPFMGKAERIGVMCVTNIEPFKELDIEKVMARLSNAIARKLGNIPEATVVSQDEIIWQLKQIDFDSTAVFAEETRTALREELNLDLMVFVELEHLQARTTPMAPTPYGLSPSPGLDLSVDLKVSLVNLHTGKTWQQTGQQRDWQPIRLQLLGSNQGERQLLMALSSPLEIFLARVAPSPRSQVRRFELSGD